MIFLITSFHPTHGMSILCYFSGQEATEQFVEDQPADPGRSWWAHSMREGEPLTTARMMRQD